ncbi:MAG: radical SAM protein [PVC group bacterium]|nr:radical SAM protein [PVC group bacterium]
MKNDEVIIICRNRIPAIDTKKSFIKRLFLNLYNIKNKYFLKNISKLKSVKKIKARILYNIEIPEWINNWRFGIFELLNFVLNDKKYVYQPQYDERFFNPTGIPTITAVYIYEFLLRKGYCPISMDNIALYERELKDKLENNPLAVVISATYFMNASEIEELIIIVRKLNKEVPIVIGSSVLLSKLTDEGKLHLEFEKLLIDENIYCILEENGLPTLDKLFRCLKNKQSVNDIDNLVFRNKEKVEYSKRKIDFVDFNNIFPDWSRITELTKGIAFVRTSRGCAFRCKFCTFQKAAMKLEQRSLESVRDELREIKKSGIEYLAFTDDHFAVHPKRIEQICQMMIDEKFDFKWFAGIRSSSITEENVVLLKKSGCKIVNIGIESGDDRMLKLMNKMTTVDGNMRCLELLDKQKITAYGSFMVGFPGETEESINNTINWINNSPLKLYKIYCFYMLPGSIIFDEQIKHNISYFGDKYDYCMWKTPTMDALRASEKLKEFILRVENAGLIYNYSPMYSFFPLFLKGYEADEVVRFFKLRTDLVKNELSDVSWFTKRKLRQAKLNKLKSMLKCSGE